MMMLQKVLNGDDVKYVSDESDCHLWRKADILPVTWNADMHPTTVGHGDSHTDQVENPTFPTTNFRYSLSIPHKSNSLTR